MNRKLANNIVIAIESQFYIEVDTIMPGMVPIYTYVYACMATKMISAS